jgi:hypothetical protein
MIKGVEFGFKSREQAIMSEFDGDEDGWEFVNTERPAITLCKANSERGVRVRLPRNKPTQPQQGQEKPEDPPQPSEEELEQLKKVAKAAALFRQFEHRFGYATIPHVAAAHPETLNWSGFLKAADQAADLEEAHLNEADLEEADLNEADLEEADLKEADLEEAK